MEKFFKIESIYTYDFILNLQKMPQPIGTIMNLTSLPFHFNFYIIIMMVLYLKKIISPYEVAFILSSQMIVGGIKHLVKRKRPCHTKIINKPEIKCKEKMKLDTYSFPSGHTFNAFLLFYILRENGIINNNYKILAYMVGLSRIFLGVHYPSDVITGALLAKGFFTLFKFIS